MFKHSTSLFSPVFSFRPSLSILFSENKLDPYKVLGVGKNDNTSTIKKKYFELAKKWHPDANKDNPNAKEKIREINNAWAVLQDPEKRKSYDLGGFDGVSAHEHSKQYGNPFGDAGSGGMPFNPFGGGGGRQGFGGLEDLPEDFLEDLSSFFGAGVPTSQKRKNSPTRGSDIEVTVNLSFMEAVNGATKDITFFAKTTCSSCKGTGQQPGKKVDKCTDCSGSGTIRRSQGLMVIELTCPSCSGAGTLNRHPCKSCKGSTVINKKQSIRVDIPAGVNTDTSVRIAHKGESGLNGGSRGHLYVKCKVSPHETFRRDGPDIHVDVPISIYTAIVGGSVSVPTLRDGDREIKVPAGTEHGSKVVLRNHGIDKLGASKGKGHQYLHFKIDIPKKLSPEQRAAMETFAEEDSLPNDDSGFFSSFGEKLKCFFGSKGSNGRTAKG